MNTRFIQFGLFVGLCLFLLTACGTSVRLPEQLDAFVDNAELRGSTYDTEDWERSMKKYETLVKQYSTSKVQYTEAEKQLAARAMGRYHALLIANGIEQSATFLKEMAHIFPSYLEGIVDGLEENSGTIKETLKSLIGEDEVFEKRMEEFEERLEEIIESMEKELQQKKGGLPDR